MTRPVGMRAELRNWYYCSDRLRWEGFVYDDVDEHLPDGTFVAIHPRDLKEVIPMGEITVFEFKKGTRWYALNSTRSPDV